MRRSYERHFNRRSYYVVDEDIVTDDDVFEEEQPESAVDLDQKRRTPLFKFGRLFWKHEVRNRRDRKRMIELLKELGTAMSELTPNGLSTVTPSTPPLRQDSRTPSGYTYLAQFLAHEITFDNLPVPPETEFRPQDARSPHIDLDSLYGRGPSKNPELYEENSAFLKIGKTQKRSKLPVEFENDLPRDEETRRALIGDERNDENLAVAQTHVAFIKFHNYVVNLLQDSGCAEADLLEFARTIVVRHFQWIVLDDLLRQLLNKDVLEKVIDKRAWYFTYRTERQVFMPLEFSAAAFRLGHTMVRGEYEWNRIHSTDAQGGVPASLGQLLEQTEFSGRIGMPSAPQSLESEWIIDWKRFYDFTSLGYKAAKSGINKAAKIDRVVSLHLETIPNFKHHGLEGIKRFITVRNLLRGFALSLPSGEAVAKRLEEPKILSAEEIQSGPTSIRDILRAPEFRDNTPLWYYILKEAELEGGEKLGPVGSRIVAETVVGLINRSRYSIFKDSGLPVEAQVLPEPREVKFRMIDLLHLANVVNPIGDFPE